MNKQEIERAIELLRNILPKKVSYANLVGASSCYGDKYVYEAPEPYALELAISALEKQLTNGWIPVSEPPSEYGTYMVAWRPINMTEGDVKIRTRSKITHFYEILEYDPEDGVGWLETIEQSEGAYKILAWQPLPEPMEVTNG